MASKSNDLWNKTYQEPFHRRIAAIIDPITALRTYGQLNYEAVTAAQTKLEAEIAQLGKDQVLYGGLGKTQGETIANSHKTLDPIIASWRASLTQDLSGLTPPAPPPPGAAPPPEDPPDAGTVLGTPGSGAQGDKTIPGQARRAAEQMRKRAAGSQGRSSTILGGSQFQASLAPRRTLLGY